METKTSIIKAHNEMQSALTPYQAKAGDLVDRYRNLTISGIEDTKGYAAVKEAAKEVRAERLAASKEAKRINSMILDIKRQFKDHADGVVAEFSQLEDGLRGELKRIDEERQELREKEEREKLRRFNERTEALFEAGFTYNGYQYTSGLVFVAAADVSDLPDSEFQVKIEEGKAEADRIEAERAETERKIAEAQAAEQRIAEAEAAEQRAKEAEARLIQQQEDAERERERAEAAAEAERRIQEADKDEQRRQDIERAIPQNVQVEDAAPETEPIPETFQPQRTPVTETVPPGFQAGFEACRNKVLAILAEPRKRKLTRKGLAQAVAEIKP